MYYYGVRASDTQVAGAVLAATLPVLFVGVASVSDSSAYGRAVSDSYPGNLEAIAVLGASWSRAMTAFMAGIVLICVGLALLTTTLFEKGSHLTAPAAFTVFLIGAVIFIVWLGLESTLPVWAGDELKRGSPSTAYLGLVSLSGVLFVTFMSLAYISIALFGVALVRSGVANWAGWATLAFGAVGAAARSADLSALGIASWAGPVPTWILAGVPGWIPLWAIALGIALVFVRTAVPGRAPERMAA